jgi:hypothetical protein
MFKIKASKKKQMRMVNESIKLQLAKQKEEQEQDLSLSHLVNTKEIILMDQLEKVRFDQSKQLKILDDELNRTNVFFKQQGRAQDREADKKTADQTPFYVRLSEKSKVIEAQLIKDEISKKEVMQYHAAYVGGKCLIQTHNI